MLEYLHFILFVSMFPLILLASYFHYKQKAKGINPAAKDVVNDNVYEEDVEVLNTGM